MRWLFLALLLAGCADPRTSGLQLAVSQARAGLKDARMVALSSRFPGTPEEQRVAAFFSEEGRALLPPRPADESAYVTGSVARIVYMRDVVLPWSVVLEADKQRHLVILRAYGRELKAPLYSESVPL